MRDEGEMDGMMTRTTSSVYEYQELTWMFEYTPTFDSISLKGLQMSIMLIR
jgi:hypothetical protein